MCRGRQFWESQRLTGVSVNPSVLIEVRITEVLLYHSRHAVHISLHAAGGPQCTAPHLAFCTYKQSAVLQACLYYTEWARLELCKHFSSLTFVLHAPPMKAQTSGQSGTVTRFFLSPVLRLSPVSRTPPILHNHSSTNHNTNSVVKQATSTQNFFKVLQSVGICQWYST